MFVPVTPRNGIGYPEGGKGAPELVDYLTLEEALTRDFPGDMFLCQYSAPALPYRLKKEVLAERSVTMVLAVFDVDDPVAHANHVPAREEWRLGESPKMAALLEAHPGGFFYETRGGYRIVYRLPNGGIELTSPEDGMGWRALYKAWVKYLDLFGIEADIRCKDWPHLFRVPHATRGDAPEDLGTIGDPSAVGEWDVDVPIVLEAPEPAGASPRPEMRTPAAERMAQAKTHLERLPPCVEGQGGDAQLFKVACLLVEGFGLQSDEAAEVLEDYNARCEPPWDDHQIEHKLACAEDVASVWGYAVTGTQAATAISEALTPQPASPSDWPSALDIIDSFGDEGDPLPTPFETLNTATRGGLRLGKMLVVGGAPGAGKTTFCVQFATHYLKAGIPVAIIAADEDLKGLLIRMGQSFGIPRESLERGRNDAKTAFKRHVEGFAGKLLAVDIGMPGATVESVSQALSEMGQGIVVIDSLQTTRTQTSDQADGPRGYVNDVVATCKQVASMLGHAVVVTSELSRASYRNKNQADQIEDLAAFKESGGIEYAMTVGLVLRSVAGEVNTVDVSTAKNRLGGSKPKFRLALDPVTATFKEVAMPAAEGPATRGKSEEQSVPDEPIEARLARLEKVAHRYVHANPDKITSVRLFRTLMRERLPGSASDILWGTVFKGLCDTHRIERQGYYFNSVEPPQGD